MTWAAAIFSAAVLIWDRGLPAGAIFCVAVVAYGTGRFLLEPLRDREMSRDTAMLRTTSLLLVATALVGIVVIWCR
jgi:prolipoprotein diacylglyceryltransferase